MTGWSRSQAESLGEQNRIGFAVALSNRGPRVPRGLVPSTIMTVTVCQANRCNDLWSFDPLIEVAPPSPLVGWHDFGKSTIFFKRCS